MKPRPRSTRIQGDAASSLLSAVLIGLPLLVCGCFLGRAAPRPAAPKLVEQDSLGTHLLAAAPSSQCGIAWSAAAGKIIYGYWREVPSTGWDRLIRELRLLDPITGAEQSFLSDECWPRLSANGEYNYSVDASGTLTRKRLLKPQFEEIVCSRCFSAAVSPDDSLVACVERGGFLSWDPDSFVVRRVSSGSLVQGTLPGRPIEFSPDGSNLRVERRAWPWSQAREVIINLNSLDTLPSLSPPGFEVASGWDVRGPWVIYGHGSSNELSRFDRITGASTPLASVGNSPWGMTGVGTLSGDGARLAFTMSSGARPETATRVFLLDLGPKTLSKLVEGRFTISRLVFSGDGRSLAAVVEGKLYILAVPAERAASLP